MELFDGRVMSGMKRDALGGGEGAVSGARAAVASEGEGLGFAHVSTLLQHQLQ
jgi:hypothetical protein